MFLHMSVSHSFHSRHGGVYNQGRESAPRREFCIQDGGGVVGQTLSILRDTVNVQAVLIPLEFILVLNMYAVRKSEIKKFNQSKFKTQTPPMLVRKYVNRTGSAKR